MIAVEFEVMGKKMQSEPMQIGPENYEANQCKTLEQAITYTAVASRILTEQMAPQLKEYAFKNGLHIEPNRAQRRMKKKH